MVYSTEKYLLNSVRKVFSGEANDVVICEALGQGQGGFYTLLIVKEHTVAKRLLALYEAEKEQGRQRELELFFHYGRLCLLFAYRRERPLEEFFVRLQSPLQEREDVCKKLLLACMSASLCFPLLYLVLTQDQIHISRDQTIYFSYQLDLARLDERQGEQACTVYVGHMIQRILEPSVKRRAVSYRLLQKKLDKGGYHELTDLYRDLSITAIPSGGEKLRYFLQTFLQRYQNRLFSMLLCCCVVVTGLALAMLLAQFIWGDIPFLRILTNPFQQIGTEFLNR